MFFRLHHKVSSSSLLLSHEFLYRLILCMILVLEPVSLVLEDTQLYHQELILYRSIEITKNKLKLII